MVSMETDTCSTRWHFVCGCLKMLLLLQKSIEIEVEKFEQSQKDKKPQELKPSQAPPLSPDTLSVKQQKTVLTTIQFIVILGILPNLDSGVGIPVERRSEFAKSLLTSGSKDELSKIQKQWRIFQCVGVFMQCLKIPSIGALLLSRHLNDVLVSLLQLIYSDSCVTAKPSVVSSSGQTNSLNVFQQTKEVQNKNDESVSSSEHELGGGAENNSVTVIKNSASSSLEDSNTTSPANWTPSSVVDMVTKAKVTQETDTNQSEGMLMLT